MPEPDTALSKQVIQTSLSPVYHFVTYLVQLPQPIGLDVKRSKQRVPPHRGTYLSLWCDYSTITTSCRVALSVYHMHVEYRVRRNLRRVEDSV